MDSEELFKNIGFVVFCIVFGLVIVYYFGQCMSFQTSIIEGLENKDDAAAAKTDSGVAGDTAASTEDIKAATVKLQDELLLDKYKADYEKKILALEDLTDMVILKFICGIKGKDIQNPDILRMFIIQLASLKTGRDALNDVMKILDKSSSSTTSSSSLSF